MYNEDLDSECSVALKYYNDGYLEMASARYEEAIQMFDRCYEILVRENRADSRLAEACLEHRDYCTKSMIERDIAMAEEQEIHIGVKEYSFGKYEGDMVVGIEFGNGKFYFNDGRVIEGVFERDYCKGKCYYPDLGVYEGEFLNFKKHGRGIFNLKDGTKCVGTWSNDFFDGPVTFMNEKTGRNEIKFYRNGEEISRKSSNKR